MSTQSRRLEWALLVLSFMALGFSIGYWQGYRNIPKEHTARHNAARIADVGGVRVLWTFSFDDLPEDLQKSALDWNSLAIRRRLESMGIREGALGTVDKRIIRLDLPEGHLIPFAFDLLTRPGRGGFVAILDDDRVDSLLSTLDALLSGQEETKNHRLSTVVTRDSIGCLQVDNKDSSVVREAFGLGREQLDWPELGTVRVVAPFGRDSTGHKSFCLCSDEVLLTSYDMESVRLQGSDETGLKIAYEIKESALERAKSFSAGAADRHLAVVVGDEIVAIAKPELVKRDRGTLRLISGGDMNCAKTITAILAAGPFVGEMCSALLQGLPADTSGQ
ncbi:MAG: hypothetical protein AB1752_06770 [Candidatus Zixiibacteriota bacterium]